MNERQYQQAVANRRVYEVARLFEGGKAVRVLGGLARAARRCERAAEAWARVEPCELQGVARVEGFEGGTLRLGVEDATACHVLRQRQGKLRRELAAVLPGVRQLDFALRGEAGVGGEAGGG